MSEELKKIHIEDSKQYPVWAWALLEEASLLPANPAARPT